MPSSPRGLKRLDAPALRTLAHPLRVRIVSSLRIDGPATATILAARLGESSGLTSYHLRVLAEAGFVAEDTEHEATGRERWWRAAQAMTSWRPDELGEDPADQATEQWLTAFTAREAMTWVDAWLQRRPTADGEWVAASEIDDDLLELTPAELRALMAELFDVVQRWKDVPPPERGERAQVRILLAGFPRA